MNPCPCGQLGNPTHGLPLHARRGAALPGHASAGRCSTASTCRSRCRRSPPTQLAARARRRAERVRRRARRGRARERALARQGTRQRARSPATRSTATAASTRPRRSFLQAAATRLGWSARSFHRVLRVARTIADLGGAATRSRPRTSPRRSSTGGSCAALSRGAAGRRERRRRKRAARRLPLDATLDRMVRPASGSRGRAGSCSGSGRSCRGWCR